jgi:hypothetical protein
MCIIALLSAEGAGEERRNDFLALLTNSMHGEVINLACNVFMHLQISNSLCKVVLQLFMCCAPTWNLLHILPYM